MCGIAGFYLRAGPADPVRVKAMCARIRHRGPDDEGFHIEGPCALGMRRLSIIDLATGHQPISNEDGSVWIVFNGEIYNYGELRAQLGRRGHRFGTNSDTETIVHLFEEQGVGAANELRGMFACALWDSRARTLTLLRDRFGKKPLYYADLPEGLFFGSEIKCLEAAGVPLDPDPEALRLYFQFSYIPDPWSGFARVRKLEPGGWLRCHGDGRIETGRYWRLPVPAERAPAGLTREAAAEELRRLFDESVRLRMIADVPLGAFLSGGLDSSSVVASMALQSDQPVKTFSIGFEEEGFNELPAAALVASRYRTDHHAIMVGPNAVDLVEKLVGFFDEPFGDSSALPTYIVSEFAARHVKVALSGDGGDELFAGYPNIAKVERMRRFDLLPQPVRRMLSAVADRLPYSAYGKNFLRAISRPNALERYFEFSTTPYFLLSQLLPAGQAESWPAQFYRRTLGHFLPPPDGERDILTEALYFEATANLPGDMLMKVDRMSMANSLEVRCPLLDHRLAEFAAMLPHAWKLEDGRGKRILMEALSSRLPPELLVLPKKGFGVPLAAWFRGELREYLWDHLAGGILESRGIVRGPFMRALFEEHQRGRRDNYHLLWRLLMLEMWFRTRVAAPRKESAPSESRAPV